MKRKIRVFDFDDTLVKTECTVTVKHSSGAVTILLPHEFATYRRMEGDIFDFSGFADVTNPIAKRHDVVLKRLLKRTDSDIVILTARDSRAREAILAYLSQTYGNTSAVQVVTLGSSEAFDKAIWLKKEVQLKGYTDVYFCDDSWANCRAVGDMLHEMPQITKLKIQKV